MISEARRSAAAQRQDVRHDVGGDRCIYATDSELRKLCVRHTRPAIAVATHTARGESSLIAIRQQQITIHKIITLIVLKT